jgi:Uncharacterized ACR, COG1993
MKTTGRATRLTVFVDENGVWHGRPPYTEIVHRAHGAGIAGATVLRAIEGYGAGGRLHTWRLLSLAQQRSRVRASLVVKCHRTCRWSVLTAFCQASSSVLRTSRSSMRRSRH